MTSLAREMTLAILSEEGAPGLLRRLADPVWFQAFGCVLGFDWHSSGLTTTACGALKQGLKDLSGETGIFHCAGATEISRVEFCRALARKLGAEEKLIVSVKLADLKLPAPRPLKCGLRLDKIRRLLGDSVPLLLDEALDRFLAERSR